MQVARRRLRTRRRGAGGGRRQPARRGVGGPAAAAHIAAMAPGTNIGAASPVGGQGADLGETVRSKAFEDAAVYYYTVSEMKSVGPTPENRLARVSGKLVPDSFVREEGSTRADFALADSEDAANRLAAAHEGVLPDLFFNEHSEIILEGRYHPDGVFVSENVIVKCPSKYVAVEDGEGDSG